MNAKEIKEATGLKTKEIKTCLSCNRDTYEDFCPFCRQKDRRRKYSECIELEMPRDYLAEESEGQDD